MREEKIAIAKQRADQACSSLFDISRSQACKAIKEGSLLINGKIITTPSYKVEVGDTLSFDYVIKRDDEILKPKEIIPINYVYKDEDIAIIDKPRGLVVHPASGHRDDTLVNQLMIDEGFNFKEEDIDSNRPGIVHRIDKDTSGLLAVARNPYAQDVLSSEIKEGDIHRYYLALVYGNVPDKRFKIDAPLTRPNHTVRKALVDPYNGRDAITHCILLANNGKVSLLKVTLETGRTHQIRAHLAYIGYPIVGDPLYGKREEKIANKGQALHAYKLSLIHPTTLKRMDFYSPLDEYMKSLLRYFYK